MCGPKFKTKMAIGAILACTVGFACQSWDLEISHFIEKIKIRGDLRKAIGLSESFAHFSGCIVIFITLIWIDLRNRKKLWCAAFFTVICGTASNAAKMMIPRYRPHSLDQSEIAIDSSWQTWGLPWTGSWGDEQFRSFPSGHSAMAVAMAIGLTQVHPRGKWFFSAIAAAACLQRLESQAHFLSDIMGGITITLVISLCYWKNSVAVEKENDGESQETIHPPPLLTTK